MADEVKFQAGIGQPVVAYNLQPYNRKALVEANVYSYQEAVTAKYESRGNYYSSKYIQPVDKGQGNVPTVLVRDAPDKTYPAQVVWGKSTPPGFTSKVQFSLCSYGMGGCLVSII